MLFRWAPCPRTTARTRRRSCRSSRPRPFRARRGKLLDLGLSESHLRLLLLVEDLPQLVHRGVHDGDAHGIEDPVLLRLFDESKPLLQPNLTLRSERGSFCGFARLSRTRFELVADEDASSVLECSGSSNAGSDDSSLSELSPFMSSSPGSSLLGAAAPNPRTPDGRARGEEAREGLIPPAPVPTAAPMELGPRTMDELGSDSDKGAKAEGRDSIPSGLLPPAGPPEPDGFGAASRMAASPNARRMRWSSSSRVIGVKTSGNFRDSRVARSKPPSNSSDML